MRELAFGFACMSNAVVLLMWGFNEFLKWMGPTSDSPGGGSDVG